MDWHINRYTPSVHIGKLTSFGASRDDIPRTVYAMRPDVPKQEIPAGEIPCRVRTFANLYERVEGQYSDKEFRPPGWVHSSPKQWWSRLTHFILNTYHVELRNIGLYEAVRATCYGFRISTVTFRAILELYCPDTRTFFTPVGELGLALHEMWEVSKLPIGASPYEEYVPCNCNVPFPEMHAQSRISRIRSLVNLYCRFLFKSLRF